MSCMITYQKQNGDIIYRPQLYTYNKKVGEVTSMGWKVIDIHYKLDGNYYLYDDYMKLIRKKEPIRKRFLKKLARKLNNLAK